MADADDAAAGASSPRAPQQAAPAADQPDMFDDLLNMDVAKIAMSPEDVDEFMAHHEALSIQFRTAVESGKFVDWVLDTLVDAGRWMDVVGYLKKSVSFHAADSVVSVPAGTPSEDLEKIHAELFLQPHRQHVFELLARHDRDGARKHFVDHLEPLRTRADGRLRILFASVGLIVDGTLLDLPNVTESARDACTAIKDYMYLYFPTLRPLLVRRHGQQEPSQVWMFGEKLTEEDGTPGFRCFSCHRVFWHVSVSHLRDHLEGVGRTAPCPAVATCTRNRLAAIPRGPRRPRRQHQGQPATDAGPSS
ncbi:hypothetical protein ACP70R_013472 [Stipagrostis hirtigluma subsp. patula]